MDSFDGIGGDNYALLLDCYLSGQISERQWQEHLQDREFAAWIEGRPSMLARFTVADAIVTIAAASFIGFALAVGGF